MYEASNPSGASNQALARRKPIGRTLLRGTLPVVVNVFQRSDIARVTIPLAAPGASCSIRHRHGDDRSGQAPAVGEDIAAH
jgi:hypothetical protein